MKALSRVRSGVDRSSVPMLVSILVRLLVDVAIFLCGLAADGGASIILLMATGRGGLFLCCILLGLCCHRPDILLPPFNMGGRGSCGGLADVHSGLA